MLCNSIGLKNQEWVRDMLMYGTGVLGVEWRNGKPFIFNIPLRDFFVDPTSTGLVQTINPARYSGYEYLASKAQLKRQQIYDADKKQWIPRYTNLEDLGPDPSKSTSRNGKNKAMDKVFKDMFNGSTLGEKATDDQIHVIKLYDLTTGKLVEIGNKKKFIYNEDTWCQRDEKTRTDTVVVDGQEKEMPRKLDKIEPFLPFAILRDYIDTSQFYGAGEMELLLHDSELLNDYEAMQIDNNAYQNTPMYWIDPQFADLAPEIETIPGAIYPIPRNAIGAIERPQLSTDLDNKEDRILGRMRRSTAADEAIQGTQTGSSRTTATEVTTQLSQAQTRFATKIQNLENEGYAQLASLIFKMVQIFVTTPTVVRVVGTIGQTFKDFDPYDYNGEFEPHALLDSTIKKNQVEVGLKDQAVFEAMNKNELFDQIEVTKWWVQLKDPTMTNEKFTKFLAKPQPPQPSIEEIKAQYEVKKAEVGAIGQMYRWMNPMGRENAEVFVGLPPDPSLQGDAQNKMLEQANQGADHMDPATRTDGSVVPGLESMMQPPEPTPAQAPSAMKLSSA